MLKILPFRSFRALEKFEADHGCVVVMETSTGRVKAIANLELIKTYYEKLNYAVGNPTNLVLHLVDINSGFRRLGC